MFYKCFLCTTLETIKELNLLHYARNPLMGLGMIEWQIYNKLDLAGSLFKQAITQCETVHDIITMTKCYCQLGFVVMANKKNGREYLEKVQNLILESGIHTDPALDQLISELRKSVEIFESGGMLFRGQCLDSLDKEILNKLHEMRVLSRSERVELKGYL